MVPPSKEIHLSLELCTPSTEFKDTPLVNLCHICYDRSRSLHLPVPHPAVSTTCLRALGGFLICKEDAPTDNIRVELQATVPSPFEDDTVMHANHEACAQESTYPRGRPQSGQLKWDIASFYSVAGVPSVRVPLDGYKNATTRSIYLIPRPLTTVMAPNLASGNYEIVSLTEGNEPTSINFPKIPYQIVRLNEPVRRVG